MISAVGAALTAETQKGSNSETALKQLFAAV